MNNGRYQEIGTDPTGSNHISNTNPTGNLRTWGVRDPNSGRTLLWVENAKHTNLETDLAIKFVQQDGSVHNIYLPVIIKTFS